MTNFELAYKKVMNIEGGHSDDKDDRGGETWKGIARNANPDWAGWKIIDSYKNLANFPGNLNNDLELQSLVEQLYKKKYWDVFRGDDLDYEIAEEMFDQSVNFGYDTAIRNLQRTINILNTKKTIEDLYPDIKVDGNFGDSSFKAYKDCIRFRSPKLVFTILNFYQGKRYIELMELREINEKYVGWFKRVEIRKY